MEKDYFKMKTNPNNSFKPNKVDGILVIIYFCFSRIYSYFHGWIRYRTDLLNNLTGIIENSSIQRLVFSIPSFIIYMVPIILIIKFRKQSFETVGITKKNLLKSILLGITFSFPILLPEVVLGLINNFKLASMDKLIPDFIYMLISISFVEELAFRGFIQSRIRGILKSKWFSILVVGVMFSVSHIPYQMLLHDVNLITYVQENLFFLAVFCIIFHIYVLFIYSKTNNILAPTITHALINLTTLIFIN